MIKNKELWVVYPCGSKLDLCDPEDDEPIAYFVYKHHAEEFGAKNWPSTFEVRKEKT